MTTPYAKFFAGLLFGLLLSACASTGGSPQATLDQTKQVYSVAQSVVLLYINLPRCGSPGATQLCSERTVVVQLAAADAAAFDSLKAAEAAVKAGSPNAMALLAAASAAATSLEASARKVKP